MTLIPVPSVRARTRRCGALLGVVAALLSTVSCRKPDTVPPPGEAPAASAAPPSASSAAALASAADPGKPAPSPLAKLVPSTPEKTVPPALQSMAPVEGCSLDQIAGHPAEASNQLGSGDALLFTGWAADANGSVPPVVILEFAGAARYFAPAARITKRPDVAAALKHPELVDSGYDALLSFAGVAPGTYSVKVDTVSASGVVLQCDTRRKIELKRAPGDGVRSAASERPRD
jgi:hypothetical protein